MIKVTTVCGKEYLIEPNEFFSNAEEFAGIVFSINGVIRIKYVTSTEGVIISAQHIVTVENVKE